MTKLRHVVSAILEDITRSGAAADAYSRELSRAYGADPILRQFTVPRARIKEITLELKMALKDGQPGGEVTGFGFEAVLTAFISALQSANASSAWRMVTDGVLTREFYMALSEQFGENLEAGLLESVPREELPAGFEQLDLEEHWDLISGAFWESLGQALRSLRRTIGAEALEPLFERIRELTRAESLALRLADGIEQALTGNEEWSALVESLLRFLHGERSANLTAPLQQEINRLTSAEPPGNRATLFNQNFELNSRQLTEILSSMSLELLFVAIEESESEELLALMEERGRDEVQGALLEISADTFGRTLEVLAGELRIENVIQRFLHSLEARSGEELMQLVLETVDNAGFHRSFQEQCLQLVITPEFHPESTENYQRSLIDLFVSQVMEFNEEAFSELLAIFRNEDERVSMFERVKETALDTLRGSRQTSDLSEDKFDLEVEVASARLQQMPPEVISSLQLTITLDDDLWPTLVTEA